MTRTLHTTAGLLGATAMALTLSACKIDNRPLLARGQPAPDTYAANLPPPGPLDGYVAPAAPAPRLAPAQAYAYPRRAQTVSRVYASRPPSYGFGYGDEQPWAWETADDGLMFAEPVSDGYRYYYYDQGRSYPYFVQDAEYGYAYGDDGALVALFDAAGALISGDRYASYYPRAEGYWRRAYDMNRAYYQRPRYRVEETVWRERAPVVNGGWRERWFSAAAARPAWREAVRYEDVVGHDNGRHLGWYKDHGREVAAAPSRAWNGDRREWREGRREWRDDGRDRRAEQLAQAQQQRDRQDQVRREQADRGRHDDHGWKAAAQDRPRQDWPRHEGGPHQDGNGGGKHGGGHKDGGQQFARAAEAHGQNAAARGPDHGQGGGGKHGDHGQDGGHGNGKGGGDKGGGDKGGGDHGHH